MVNVSEKEMQGVVAHFYTARLVVPIGEHTLKVGPELINSRLFRVFTAKLTVIFESNAEKRSGLIKTYSCLTLLTKYAITRQSHIESIYNSSKRNYDRAKESWEEKNNGSFPAFRWSKTNPGSGVPDLTGLWNSKDEIAK